MRSKVNRTLAVVTAATLALTAFNLQPAAAAPEATTQARTAQPAGDYEFSSRRRRYHRNNAAAIAAFTAVVGAIATYAAAREYRKAHQRGYYYGNPYGPYYYPRPYRSYYYYW
jgi:hypothetical protein